MIALRIRHRLPFVLLVWLASMPGAAGQDTLSRAKDLYVLAAYDEALLVLGRLHETAAPPESSEIAGYQVFCLLALGRNDEADKAITALVKADPLYRPSESTTSPRTRAAFDTVRCRLLPGIVQEIYDQAKGAYDRKEAQAAVAEFDRVLTLLDEPGMSEAPNMADLRRLASGFRDLSRAAAAPAPAAAKPSVAESPAAPPSTPAAGRPDASAPTAPPAAPRVYSSDDTGVVPPTTVSRVTPPWLPGNDIEKRRQFRGVLEVVVDETGGVMSAALGKGIHPRYDRQLVERARAWKFRPATRDGVPVRYRMTIEIVLGPAGS